MKQCKQSKSGFDSMVEYYREWKLFGNYSCQDLTMWKSSLTLGTEASKAQYLPVRTASIIELLIVYSLFSQLKSNCIIIVLLLEDMTLYALIET